MGIYHEAYGDKPEGIEYEGRVFCDREENYYDDSDGYSHVWDGEKVIRVGTWTTRCHSVYAPGKVDAYDEDNPEHEAMRQAHIDAITRIWLSVKAQEYDEAVREARKPKKGEYVVVVKGRKVPIGTEGVIFWQKDDEYSYNYYSKDYDKQRIGIDIGDGEVAWTTDNNVVVLDPDMPDPEDYIGEMEYRKELEGLTLQRLHGMLCAATASLRYIR